MLGMLQLLYLPKAELKTKNSISQQRQMSFRLHISFLLLKFNDVIFFN